MKKASNSRASALRQQAEELLKEVPIRTVSHLSEPEMRKLLHELEVRQIELELQNKELVWQNQELILEKEKTETAHNKYTELYDFAPIAYFSLSQDSTIVEVNFSGAKMLHLEKSALKNKLLSSYITDTGKPIFELFLSKVFKSKVKETCELTLPVKSGAPILVYLTGQVNIADEQCLVTMVDITGLRLTTYALPECGHQHVRILNDISDVVWSVSWPDMNPIYISPSVLKVYGRSANEFFRDPNLWAGIVHPDDQDLSEKALATLHTKGSAVRECRVLKSDGSIIWINDKSRIIFDSNRNPIRIDGVSRDITEQKQSEIYREMNREILLTLNEQRNLKDTVHLVIGILKRFTGFDAIGIRLQNGDDFPYFGQDGFSENFLKTENSLIAHNADGGMCRDADGKICLECTCGLVISGTAKPGNSLFTVGGSIWTNDSLPFLDTPESEDMRLHPRNQCIHQGYASVALVPIRSRNTNVGLIQFNDHQKGRFTDHSIEQLEGIASHIGEALMRKQAEEALHSSNELLSLFMMHSPIFSFIKEVSQNESRVLRASENYREMIGIPGSEMVNKNMYELFPEELAVKMTADDWSVVSEGKQLEIEESLNGRTYYSLKYPIKQGDKNLLAGFSIDITERRLTEEKLHESEQRYRILIETAQEGILVAQGSRFKFVNPKMSELTGYTEDELLAMPFLDLVHHDDKELVKSNYLKRTQGEFVENRYHFRVYKKDNSINWIEMSGVKTEWEGQPAVINVVTDITDRVHAEQALKDSESRARAILNAIPDLMFMLDSQGVYLDYKSNRDDLGYRGQSLIGLRNRDIAPTEFADLVDEKIKLCIQTGDIQVFDCQLPLPTGEAGEFEARMAYCGTDKVVVIVRNITERKAAEAEIQLKNDELEKLNIEKDKIFSIIAHDLRSPFQTLLGFSLMRADDLLTLPLEEIQKIAVNMRNSANKLFNLLENLLDWSQLQRGVITVKMKAFMLSDRIDEIIDLIRDTADKKKIEITLDIPEKLIILADTQMFESLMRNLVFNAVKFTPKGGKVMISAKVLTDSFVEIAVHDTGIGMNSELRENLFRLNAQTSRKGTDGEPSAGLGLIICKDFIEKLGGEIFVESQEGIGSTFKFTLPTPYR